MKWKALFAVFIIVALLGGFIGVPVARATIVVHAASALLTAPSYINITAGSGAAVVYIVTATAGLTNAGNNTIVAHCGDGSAGYVNAQYIQANVEAGSFDGFKFSVPYTGSESAYHTISTLGGVYYYGTSNYYQMIIPAVSYVVTLVNTNGWVAYNTRAMAPVSVSITGSATASIGVNTSFAAVIVGGAAPYSTTWHVDGTGGNEGVLLDASNVSPAGLTVKFATISHYIVRATVVDAIGGMASATYDVNLMSSKPVMHGQIIRAEAAESYTFNMYTDGVVLTDGVAAASDCIPSAEYEVTSPTVIMQSEYGWQVWPVSPLPNPLYVYVTYHAPETGFVWSYRFTMDTSILTGAGTWTKSDGTGSDDGATLAPTWVDGLLNRLKIVLIDSSKAAFRWLFVPDAAQMALLMPQGTVQADGTLSKEGNIAASLLEGTTWGAGASEWKLTVHYATFSITLVDIDFTAMRSSAFVRGIRFAIQAVMSMSLVYLVVVLI